MTEHVSPSSATMSITALKYLERRREKREGVDNGGWGGLGLTHAVSLLLVSTPNCPAGVARLPLIVHPGLLLWLEERERERERERGREGGREGGERRGREINSIGLKFEFFTAFMILHEN